jgi:hypothetical protein
MSIQSQRSIDEERIARENGEQLDENEVTETRSALVTPPVDADADTDPDAAADADARYEEPAKPIRDDSTTTPARDANYGARTDEKVEHETPYLSERTSQDTDERWRHIQSEFVDDPRKSVAEAHKLVGDVVQQIVDAFAAERSSLEQQWSKGDSVSTEELRVCLQRYRAFFTRLLPSMKDIATH